MHRDTPRVPGLGYGPIRAAVRARLVEDDREWHSVTETCHILAVIAHDQQAAWCQQPTVKLGGWDPRAALHFMEQTWASEIEAIRQVSALVITALTGAGCSTAEVEAGIQRKLRLELLLGPPSTLN